MRFILVFIFAFVMSCGSDKIIELPEIKYSNITEITDISPAYIFYDETQPDSLELNRKNLISTTNWVVNIDKRLTLGQVIPQIQFLQNKKNNSSHKNEAAKNYFTCNNTSIKNLGFIEFTGVNYHLEKKKQEEEMMNLENQIKIFAPKLNTLQIKTSLDSSLVVTTIDKLFNELNTLSAKKPFELTLNLSAELTFQDYITLKDELTRLNSEDFVIHTSEFIY